MNPPNRSSNAPLSGLGVDHAESELISKLKGLEFEFEVEVEFVSAREAGDEYDDDESKADANEVNIGLLAMVVYCGLCPAEKLFSPPNPKSICIAPSVAVCCGVSSSSVNIPGSNVVSELQSNGFAELGVGDEAGIDAVGDRMELRAEAVTVDFGTENVKVDSLSITFSFCSRERRSRRFSFSEVAASFLASRAATLSSSLGRT
jgi:hypothetical protein